MTKRLVQIGGCAAIAGGVIVAAGGTLLWWDAYREDLADRIESWGDIATITGAALLVIGFASLHIRHRSAYRPLGHIALVLIALGLLTPYPLGFILVPLGLVLYGTALWRADFVPRTAAILFASSAPAAFVSFLVLEQAAGGRGEWGSPIFLALHCTAWVWLGWSLARSRATFLKSPGFPGPSG